MLAKVCRLVQTAFGVQDESAVREACCPWSPGSICLVPLLQRSSRTGVLKVRVYEAIDLVCRYQEGLYHLQWVGTVASGTRCNKLGNDLRQKCGGPKSTRSLNVADNEAPI